MILVPALPLAAAIAVAVLGPADPAAGRSHWPVVLALAASCLCSLAAVAARPSAAGAATNMSRPYWTWVLIEDAYHPADSSQTGGQRTAAAARDFAVDVALRLDALTCIMLTMVTFISLLVAIYSVGYMHGDRGLLAVLRLHRPVRVLDDDAGVGQQLPVAVRVLGGGGGLQLPADRLLVRKAVGGGGRHEGVSGQPHR